MQSAAILWHISLLVPADRRALALGLVGLVRIGPIILFSLISGVAADALDRRKLMLVTQSLMTAGSGTLAILTLHGLSTVWPIYALAAFGSAAGAFDLPARQSMVPNLVPPEHLPNAISLNTSMVQIASVGGPAIGGLVIATKGVGWAYAINAVSYLFVIAALLMMRESRPAAAGRHASPADHAAASEPSAGTSSDTCHRIAAACMKLPVNDTRSPHHRSRKLRCWRA